MAASTVQFPTMEGPVRESDLEAKIASALRLDFVLVVEVDSTSMSEDTSEVG